MGLKSALLAALLAALGATPAPASEDTGLASFYSGVPGPAGEFTAAHRSLPLGTRVRVTKIPSGRSVIVRINDRGPLGPVSDRAHQRSRALCFRSHHLCVASCRRLA